MSRIPERFVEDLLARVDLVALIGAYVPLKKAGREYVACCPFHREKTPSFTVNNEKQFYHCFGCGAHGTAIRFLMEYAHLEFLDAVATLAERGSVPMPRELKNPRDLDAHPSSSTDLYEVLDATAHFYQHQLRQSSEAITYLKGRGLTGPIAGAFRIGYAPPGRDILRRQFADRYPEAQLALAGLITQGEQGHPMDRFRQRVMFPIRDPRGRVIGFGGRVLNDKVKPKYLNSPETPLFHKRATLYGLYEARRAISEHDQVIVVEGYMDVMGLAAQGVTHIVATLGTATTTEHIQALYRLAREIVFCFDGDQAGRQAAWRALEQLLPAFQDGKAARFALLPEGEDPDSLIRRDGSQAFLQFITTAPPVDSFLFATLKRNTDLTSASDRAQLAVRVRSLLKKLPPGVFKTLMYQQLDTLIGITGRPSPSRVTRTPRPQAPRSNRYNIVYTALSLLLVKPDLAMQAGDPSRFKLLPLADIMTFIELLETLQENPYLDSEAIAQRFPLLEKIKQTRIQEQGLLDFDRHIREFNDAICKLDQRLVELRLEELLKKEQSLGLGHEEKLECRHLLSSLHRL